MFFSGGVIKLFPATSDINLGLRFTLDCIIAGDNTNRSIIFERNDVRICQRRLYENGGNTYCNSYNVTLSGYGCKCVQYDTDTSQYRLVIQSFTAVDATRWSCKTDNMVGIAYVSNFVDLYCKLIIYTVYTNMSTCMSKYIHIHTYIRSYICMHKCTYNNIYT